MDGKRTIQVSSQSTLSSLLPLPEDMGTLYKGQLQEVDLKSVDNFCYEHHIENISFLKVDTEGYDLEVLKGAENMLKNQAAAILQVEAGMSFRNALHTPFEELKAHLEHRQYVLFGIYEQVREWTKNEPHLRRANLVFISEQVIAENRK